MIGKIVHIVSEKGFGFIQCDGYEGNLFFHVKDLKGIRIDDLKKGDQVSFGSVEEVEKGLRAKEVSVLM